MNEIHENAYQCSLFDSVESETAVNIASIPQRSPFRYPGGKTWFVPRIRQWLLRQNEKPNTFLEPFAGGGIISLTVAFENLAERVVMVELDADVASVWHTILYGNAAWLAERITSFSFDADHINETLSNKPGSTCDRAFHTILRNRINHGGILAPGSGRLKNGENGKGLASRWYPQTLKSRILNIESVAHKITFIHGDGLKVLEQHTKQSDTASFIDPPYTAAGKRAGSRLYAHSDLDHERLFQIAQKLAGKFLMTYDNAEGVKTLAKQYCLAARAIPMKNTHHAAMTELLISTSLDWA